MTKRRADTLVTFYCTVLGENDDLLGVDETPITKIYWSAIDVKENEVVRKGQYSIHDPKELDENSSNQMLDKKSRTLKQALEHFNDVLAQLSKNNRQVQLVTENGLHLRQCLHPRTFEKDIKLANLFYYYFDLRKEYTAFREKEVMFKNLESIVKDMIIKPEETVLTTFEEKASFCTKVTRHLLREGHKFNLPDEIYRSMELGLTLGYVKDDTIIRARGLPWQVSDTDVADFFVGLNIAKGGVALCLNLKGRRNGEALVRFETCEQRDMALRRHKHHLFGRYIEVYKGTSLEFIKIARGPAIAMATAATFLSNGGEVIIRMRGLPFDAKASEIITFFGESPKVYHGEDGVMLVSHPDGSSTGDAFVLFERESEGQLALKKHRQNIGKRYVELFRSTRAELQQVLTMYNVGYQLMNPVQNQIFPSQTPNIMADRALINQRLQALMNMSCLRMRGLPFSAGQKDILNFLGTHGDNIVGTVHIIYNLQGRPSGEAFVQLQNPDQAHKCANELHLKHMGERYIEVFQCSVQDMTWMLATSHANQLAAQQMNQISNSKNNNSNSTSYQPHSKTPSPPPVQQTTQVSQPINGLITPPPPPITTTTFLPPNISSIPVYPNQYQPIMTPVPAGYLPPPHHIPHTQPIPHPGIPPMVSQVYNPESLQFQMNPYGKPNGVAYITFASPEEAHRAVHEKHKQHIGNRYVEMFIAN